MDESSSITLLQLIQEVAYCDGSMSQDEEDLISSLIDSHGLQEDREAMKNRLLEDYSLFSNNKSVARGSKKRIERNELLNRLSTLKSKEEQDLAVKLAYLTVPLKPATARASRTRPFIMNILANPKSNI